MSSFELPERASLEFLKKRAKERLAELRRENAAAKLTDAQLLIAREYGFPSWRALKAEIDGRAGTTVTEFFRACQRGDIVAIRYLLHREPDLVHHRDKGDNATPLHFAVAHGVERRRE
jgi:hypothetical protein